MPQPVLVALGPFLFYASAPSFEKFKNHAQFRWVQQPRIARDLAAQFMGPGLRTVTLDGHIYPETLGGGKLLPNMAQAARSGSVYPLISMIDSGLAAEVNGTWVIKSIQDERTFWSIVNGARQIAFTIELEGYGPDGGGFTGAIF